MMAHRNTVHALPWTDLRALWVLIAGLMALLLAGLHSALNVKSAGPQTAAAAVSPLSLASPQPIKAARDARLPPLQEGDSVEVRTPGGTRSYEIRTVSFV